MDKNQIIHIASEAVVISGLTIYFQLKTNSLLTKIEELQNRIDSQDELIKEFINRFTKQEYQVRQHEYVLKSLSKPQKQVSLEEEEEDDIAYYRNSAPVKKPKSVERKRRVSIETKRAEPQVELKRTEQEAKVELKRVEPKKVKLPSPPHSHVDETEEDLDEEILNELNELTEAHSEEDEIIEIDTSLKKKA